MGTAIKSKKNKINDDLLETAILNNRSLEQDLYFEKELKRRKRVQIEKQIKNNPKEVLEKLIEKMTELKFNNSINCGGYALKIDRRIYPNRQNNFCQSVSSILDRFPFVRLLGDTKLEEDEYLVIYRAPKGENKGHHFIRVDSDGIVREKDGSGRPRIFVSWGRLEDAEEALFAVKKEHRMFGYSYQDVDGYRFLGMDFEQIIIKNIKEENSDFVYHNHNFFIEKTENKNILKVKSSDLEIATVELLDDEIKISIEENKKVFIENFSGKLKPIIQNGKLVNIEKFRK